MQAHKHFPAIHRLIRAQLNESEETLLRYISLMPEITLDCTLLAQWQLPIEKNVLDALAQKRLLIYDSEENTARIDRETSALCRDALHPNQENCAKLLRVLAGDTEDLESGLIFQNIPQIVSIYCAVCRYIQGGSEDITAVYAKTVRELAGDLYREEWSAIFHHWLIEYKHFYGANSAPVAHLYLHWGQVSHTLLYLEKSLTIYQSLTGTTSYQLERAIVYSAIAHDWLLSQQFCPSAQGQAAYQQAYRLLQNTPQPILNQEKNLFLLYETLSSCDYLYHCSTSHCNEMEVRIHTYQASYGNKSGSLARLYVSLAAHYYADKDYLRAQYLYHTGLSILHNTPSANKHWLTGIYRMLCFVALDDEAFSLAQQYNELAYYARNLYPCFADERMSITMENFVTDYLANLKHLVTKREDIAEDVFSHSFTSYDIQGELERLAQETPATFAVAKQRLQQEKCRLQDEP